MLSLQENNKLSTEQGCIPVSHVTQEQITGLPLGRATFAQRALAQASLVH